MILAAFQGRYPPSVTVSQKWYLEVHLTYEPHALQQFNNKFFLSQLCWQKVLHRNISGSTLFSMHCSLILFFSWLHFQAKTFRFFFVARLGESSMKRRCWNFPWTSPPQKKNKLNIVKSVAVMIQGWDL